MKLEVLPQTFSVCKVADYGGVDLGAPFVFTGATDGEKSLVCPTALVPASTFARSDGWRAFRVAGTLDFSLVGILAALSKALADAGVGIFAISTFDTDYILTKATDFDRVAAALTSAGHNLEYLPDGYSTQSRREAENRRVILGTPIRPMLH